MLESIPDGFFPLTKATARVTCTTETPFATSRLHFSAARRRQVKAPTSARHEPELLELTSDETIAMTARATRCPLHELELSLRETVMATTRVPTTMCPMSTAHLFARVNAPPYAVYRRFRRRERPRA